MPRQNFEALDTAILAAIVNGKRDFTSIAYSEAVEALAKQHVHRLGEAFRVVDRRLQAMRKKAYIVFEKKEWRLVES